MKLQVWNMINFERNDHYNVKSVDEGIILIDTLANAQLKNDAITDNSFDLLVFNEEEYEWETWYDESGLCAEDFNVKDGKVVLLED